MDYFLVYTLTSKLVQQDPAKPQTANMPTKTFYWCSSQSFCFASLPAVAADKGAQLIALGSLFTGEFGTVLIESTEAPKVIDAARGIVLQPKHLTELDRLAATVQEIDRSCSSVPRGALKYTPLHQVVTNEAFRGLTKDEAFKLEGWVHSRAVENQTQKDLIARHEAVYSDDFLDNVSEDKPRHCWSIIKDTTGTVATLRSQLWPGYFAYHRSNTPIYGSVYIGEGIKNIDLPFMI